MLQKQVLLDQTLHKAMHDMWDARALRSTILGAPYVCMTMHVHMHMHMRMHVRTDTQTHMYNCLLATCTHMHIHIHRHRTHIITACLHRGFFPFHFSARVRCLYPCNPIYALCTANHQGLCQAPTAQMPSDDLHQMGAALTVEMLTKNLTISSRSPGRGPHRGITFYQRMDSMWRVCSRALHKQHDAAQLLASHADNFFVTHMCARICLWHAPLATKKSSPAAGNSDLKDAANDSVAGFGLMRKVPS